MALKAQGRPFRRRREQFLTEHTVCWICGHDGAGELDHIIALSRGGDPYDMANWAPAHGTWYPCPHCGRKCNQEKSNRADLGYLRRNMSRDW